MGILTRGDACTGSAIINLAFSPIEEVSPLEGRLFSLAPGRNPAFSPFSSYCSPIFSLPVAHKGPIGRFDKNSLEVLSSKFKNWIIELGFL